MMILSIFPGRAPPFIPRLEFARILCARFFVNPESVPERHEKKLMEFSIFCHELTIVRSLIQWSVSSGAEVY